MSFTGNHVGVNDSNPNYVPGAIFYFRGLERQATGKRNCAELELKKAMNSTVNRQQKYCRSSPPRISPLSEAHRDYLRGNNMAGHSSLTTTKRALLPILPSVAIARRLG